MNADDFIRVRDNKRLQSLAKKLADGFDRSGHDLQRSIDRERRSAQIARNKVIRAGRAEAILKNRRIVPSNLFPREKSCR